MPIHNVQTQLPDSTYGALARLAQSEQKPIKTVVREAIEGHLREKMPSGEADPLWGIIGSVALGGGWSTRKDWRA